MPVLVSGYLDALTNKTELCINTEYDHMYVFSCSRHELLLLFKNSKGK